MRIVLFAFLLLHTGWASATDYLNAFMVDVMQYERGQLSTARKNEIITAFRNCNDPEVKKAFIEDDYFEEKSNNGLGVYVTQDSLKWNFRVRHCCYADMDGDDQKEILFHEKDFKRSLQLSVLLKKKGQVWEVVYREYGVFSSVLFEGRMLRGITTVELHQNANPCDIFKLYKATSGEGRMEIRPDRKIHVPHFYHYPVKVEKADRPVIITSDTLYFYDVALYNQMDFPYKKEMRNEFAKDRKFNSHESAWFSLVPATIYWSGYVESRGEFSSLLIAFNRSYATTFPEYLFLYATNDCFKLL